MAAYNLYNTGTAGSGSGVITSTASNNMLLGNMVSGLGSVHTTNKEHGEIPSSGSGGNSGQVGPRSFERSSIMVIRNKVRFNDLNSHGQVVCIEDLDWYLSEQSNPKSA